MLGKLKELTTNTDGSQDITITIKADARELFDEFREKEVEVTIKKFSKKRSLDANAKAWVMIDQLAEKLKIPKTEVYRNAIKEIGGVSSVICVREYAAETLCEKWRAKGQGWMAETCPSKLPGCVNVTVWYGSSLYNTSQMADLINILVQECNEQGIPTMTEDEVDKCLASWQKKVDKNETVDSST